MRYERATQDGFARTPGFATPGKAPVPKNFGDDAVILPLLLLLLSEGADKMLIFALLYILM